LKLGRDSDKRAQEVDLFQVPKLERDNVFKSADETQCHKARRRKFKGEAFETFEIFQVREESKSSRGGTTVVVGSSIVKNLDCQIRVQTTRNEHRGGQIWTVRFECEDQQSLDPKESARGLTLRRCTGEWTCQHPEVLK